MTALERLEQDVAALSPEDFAEFREWFLEHDWQAWDRKLERDIAARKLDELAKEAREHRAAGRTKPL
jgi:hypothetical protein